MSVYSGFATRKHEQHYNASLYHIIQMLCSQITHVDQDFSESFLDHMRSLSALERHKYLEPKFSDAMINVFRLA